MARNGQAGGHGQILLGDTHNEMHGHREFELVQLVVNGRVDHVPNLSQVLSRDI